MCYLANDKQINQRPVKAGKYKIYNEDYPRGKRLNKVKRL